MRFAGLIGLVPFVLIAACTAQTTSNPAPPPQPVAPAPIDGTFTVDWSINRTKDPNQCNQSLVAAIQIVVTRSDGASAGTFQQACTAFATSITLEQGSYLARATLIDANGTPRTTPIDINPFTLQGNDELKVPIDFPSSSFE